MRIKYMNKKGFSLIEVLIVIAIISILASVILANLMGAKQDAKDAAFFQAISPTAALACNCIKKDIANVRIGNNNFLCCEPANCANQVAGFPNWPNVSNTGWSRAVSTAGAGSTTTNMYWCSINDDNNVKPVNWGLAYGTASSPAANPATGQFCYMFYNNNNTAGDTSDDKIVWCTEDGCKKSGF